MPEERIFPREGFGFRTIRGFRNDHTARTGILRPGAKQFALSEITVEKSPMLGQIALHLFQRLLVIDDNQKHSFQSFMS